MSEPRFIDHADQAAINANIDAIAKGEAIVVDSDELERAKRRFEDSHRQFVLAEREREEALSSLKRLRETLRASDET